ncbi:MAG: HepT-like ribonuclease domain-containing protein [Chthoniobacterales bacterium]
MSRNPQLRLRDVLEACSRIASYIEGFDHVSFGRDLKTQDAVIRQFEIIGEAVKTLPVELLALEPSIPWSQIAGFRDVLAHSYFAVDSSVVWDAASNKAPALAVACERLLSMRAVIDGFRWAICGTSQLHAPSFLLSMAVTACFLWLGVWYFRRTERTFADVI